MIHESIKHIQVDGHIWSLAVDGANRHVFLDVRRDGNDSIQLIRLRMDDLKLEAKEVENPWWSKLIGVQDGKVQFVEYPDQNDPTRQKYFTLDWESLAKTYVEGVETGESLTHPFTYEHSSEYHQTVAEFLSLELPLSCEYLEWGDKIIISYYLRSGNGFDRYLLLLKDGAKQWKVTQDAGMKGFSPGAFFVFEDQLIFIKDRNEVCMYTD